MKQLIQRWFRTLAIIIIVPLICLLPKASHAQSEQQAIVNGMRQIAGNWSAAIRDGAVFLHDDSYGSSGPWWSAARLRKDTTVSFDVKKTDSLVNPYVGILMMNGVVERNDECKTPEAALANNNYTPNLVATRDLVAYYNFDGQRFTLSSGSEVFTNGILSAFATPSVHNTEVISKFGLLELRVKTN